MFRPIQYMDERLGLHFYDGAATLDSVKDANDASRVLWAARGLFGIFTSLSFVYGAYYTARAVLDDEQFQFPSADEAAENALHAAAYATIGTATLSIAVEIDELSEIVAKRRKDLEEL